MNSEKNGLLGHLVLDILREPFDELGIFSLVDCAKITNIKFSEEYIEKKRHDFLPARNTLAGAHPPGFT